MKADDDRGGQFVVAGRRNVYSVPVLVLAGAGGIAGVGRTVGEIVGIFSNISYALLQVCQLSRSSYWRGSRQYWGEGWQPEKRCCTHDVR